MARAWITDRHRVARWRVDWLEVLPGGGTKRRSQSFADATEASIQAERVAGAVSDTWKGSRWRVDWYEEQADGSRKLRGKSFRTKPLAEDFLAKVEHDIRSGTYRTAEGGKKTVKEVADGWLAAKRRPKHATLHAYRGDLRVWIVPAWGGRAIGGVTRHDVEEWLTSLLAGTAPRDYQVAYTTERGKMGASRVRRLHAVLSSVFGHAVEHGWIAANPVRGVELPRLDDAEQIFLTIEELEALAEAATTASDRALALTLGYVGLRIGEAAALRTSDVDLVTRRAVIRATLTTVDNRHAQDRSHPNCPASEVPGPGAASACIGRARGRLRLSITARIRHQPTQLAIASVGGDGRGSGAQ